jgi:hypothetical protein
MRHVVVKQQVQLIRTVNPPKVSKNVKIVINQAQKQVLPISRTNTVQTPQPIISVQSHGVLPTNNNVVNKRNIVKQPQKTTRNTVVNKVVKKANGAKVHYVTREISDDSKRKINKIKSYGIGKILIIIANGPSINEVELNRLRGYNNIDTMSINRPDQRIWPTTHWAFCDPSQYTAYKDLWETYSGTIINSTGISHLKENSIQIKNIGGFGFSFDLIKGFYIGRSTTYANMQTALWMAYDKVYIFGVDMCEVNGVLHFYGVNPAVPPEKRIQRFAQEAKYYEYAAANMSEADRSKFVFCSSYNQWPFVEKFNRLDHAGAIDHILNNHCVQI